MAKERIYSNSPRGAAVEILNRIEQDGGRAEPLLDECLSGASIGNLQDRGLLTELVYGTLRMRGRLDWIISGSYRGDFDGLEVPVRNILRSGAYQLFFLDRIPAFAAVNESVAIAKKRCPAAAGLVNAILRSALREKDRLEWPDMAKNPGRAIAVIHSHPRWLVERWLDRHGIDETISICRSNNSIPPLTLRANSLKISRDEAVSALAADGIIAEATLFSPHGLSVTEPAAGLRKSPAFMAGLIRIQDEASQLVSLICGPKPEEAVLDLCAGTGGKTLHMAALMQNRGRIMAVDLVREKLDLLVSEACRMGVNIAKARRGDASRDPHSLHELFDLALLDAPCSGLGTLRRNPEIRWQLAETEIQKHACRQRALLDNAANFVKPGGRLVYSVCTTTPEENESLIADFIASHNQFMPVRPEGIDPGFVGADNFFRSFPHRHGTDGFFGAVLVRSIV